MAVRAFKGLQHKKVRGPLNYSMTETKNTSLEGGGTLKQALLRGNTVVLVSNNNNRCMFVYSGE